jgi:pantoate--beta-alanine ligase
MQVVRSIAHLESFHGGTLVPTMGALHEGHASLIRLAGWYPGPTVVSVFVNPTQFAPDEDFDRYPRQLDADAHLIGANGGDVVFAPTVETMYPPEEDIAAPDLPPVATQPGLEDTNRPTHFAGVCQVVARLFDLTRPSVAIFGEKDYQQMQVIGAMVKAGYERWGDLKIVAGPTMREGDGLAMSSRNRYLDHEQRQQAIGLHRALTEAQKCPTPAEAEAQMVKILEEHGLTVDYAVVRDADTLLPIDGYEHPARALIAARLGEVRLIDNAPIGSSGAASQ